MHLSLPKFFLPPPAANYEQAQKAKLLHVMLLAIFGGALLMIVVNARGMWWVEAAYLGLLAGACLIGFLLNRRSRFQLAAVMLCSSLWLTIALVSYEGAALYDEGMVALPVFIFCAAFLLGMRALFGATLFSIALVVAFYLLEVFGVFDPIHSPSLNRVMILSAIILVGALIVWVTRETWETHLEQLNESYDKTLQGWAKALEYRDDETAEHSRRVSEMTLELAHRLHCKPDEMVAIQRGAYLHDIGKLAIPDHILLKPGPLDQAEQDIMRRHPQLALDLLADIPFLQSAAIIPYCHHEYWDGSGYPRGLKGEAIPFAARIFTVVDHWDALSSDRPYRKAWDPERVLAHLQENAGKIYDPRVVASFMPLAEKNLRIARQVA